MLTLYRLSFRGNSLQNFLAAMGKKHMLISAIKDCKKNRCTRLHSIIASVPCTTPRSHQALEDMVLAYLLALLTRNLMTVSVGYNTVSAISLRGGVLNGSEWWFLALLRCNYWPSLVGIAANMCRAGIMKSWDRMRWRHTFQRKLKDTGPKKFVLESGALSFCSGAGLPEMKDTPKPLRWSKSDACLTGSVCLLNSPKVISCCTDRITCRVIMRRV